MISQKLEQILNKAIKRANEKRHEFLTLENVLLSMLEDETVVEVLVDCGANLGDLRTDLANFLDEDSNFSLLSEDEIQDLNRKQFGNEQLREIARENGIMYQPEISLSLQRVIQRAAIHIQSSGKKSIQAINLLVAMFSEKESHATYFLERQGVTRIDIVEKIAHSSDRPMNRTEEAGVETPGETFRREEKYEKALSEFTTNLNELAKKGKIDPIIGREDEIQRIIQILCRRRKNNPILVGDSGVGKTAIAEGLAKAIVENRVPSALSNTTVYALDMASLLAGTKFRGDFEERLKMVLQALEKENDTDGSILFIDEIHTIIGAGATSGGSLDASNLLKPALSKGQIRCMGSTTFDEYRKYFEKDQALNRRFQKIDVLEPSVEDSVKILQGLKSKFEEHHQVKYPDAVLKAAVELSHKHISDRKLPDKAIDIIDEVGAYLRLKPENAAGGTEVTLPDIEHIVAKIARIPQKSISVNEKEKLRFLERDLKMMIYGQDQAIDKVSNALILSRSGLGNVDKPIASFLFTGPTGVGKTELAKQLAHIMGINFVRIDMSEFMEKHTVSKLIGAPPGYVGFEQGGILTDAIHKTPYSVLLLDEIEKAHPDVFNILLQVMDHGALADSNGRTSDFRNVILIMTSNAGAKEMEAGSIGLASKVGMDGEINSAKRDQAIKNYFTPEFRNRLDAVVGFNKLSNRNIDMVVSKFLMELENQLVEKKVELEVSPEAREWMSRNGYDDKLGARPIARLINDKIKKPLAHEILFGKLEKGGKVIVNVKNDDLDFTFS
ncbi:MAG: ATP-dependent Clp protease ATP-binding subunit ClpA [Bacteriovoracia bacterium]